MITIYTKTVCPHCVAAKTYLNNHGIAYTEVDVQADPEALAFLKTRGHGTVPQLYVGESLLVEGGNSGLQALGADEVRERVAKLLG